ncbi:hypothetical protein SDC9_60370 [bioreactor metagenome]|uniref:Uncharacterized protein n=1 Tax=bioreactor metagenome TaxID=1076179 RepID=A0A644XCR4_9ZZZZ
MAIYLLQRIFPNILASITFKETFDDFEYSCDLSDSQIPSNDELETFLTILPKRDKINLTLKNNDGFCKKIIRNNKIFYPDKEEIDPLLELHNLQVEFTVNKSISNGRKSIYSLEIFQSFLSNLGIEEAIRLFANELKGINGIVFELINNNDAFRTDRIVFTPNKDEIYTFAPNETIKYIREYCNFGNSEEFQLDSSFFHLGNQSKYPELSNVFGVLSTIFSIISIYDISSIGNSVLKFKLHGYKSIEGQIPLDQIEAGSEEVFYDLFDWIYSEKSKIFDKLGVTRNVLSLYQSSSPIIESASIIPSIKSSFQIYQKENIQRYLDVREKINNQLIQITNDISKIGADYADNFKKSISAFLTFFISVFIITVISTGSIQVVFTKDTSIMSLMFLVISLLFLLYATKEFSNGKEQININYQNAKEKFKGLLIEEDINRILNHDKEYLKQIEFINTKFHDLSALWISILVIFFIVIILCSGNISWNFIKNIILDKLSLLRISVSFPLVIKFVTLLFLFFTRN